MEQDLSEAVVEEAPPTPAEALAEVAGQIRLCRNCDLVLGRRQAVPGEGNPRARIMFIGEAPGATEDERGRPFVGAAGRFLDEMLADIGLRRRDVFIGNVIRCRPPDNRDPLPDEIDACARWLRAHLRIIRPKVVCTLGRFAMHALVDPHLSISRVHGTPIEKAGILYIPLLHPAAALHKPDLRETEVADMRKVRALLMARGLWEEEEEA